MAVTEALARDAQYVIYRAFRLLRKIRPGDTLELDEQAQALQVLQDMMREWDLGDVSLHKIENIRLVLAASTGQYNLGQFNINVRDVVAAEFYYTPGGSNSFSLIPITFDAYRQMPNKDSDGTPSQYMFSKSKSSMTPHEAGTGVNPDDYQFYIWPRPSAALVANGAVLELAVKKPYAVPTLLTDPLDCPQAWYNALTYRLAAELFEEYGGNDIRQKAWAMWDDVLSSDRPDTIEFIMDWSNP